MTRARTWLIAALVAAVVAVVGVVLVVRSGTSEREARALADAVAVGLADGRLDAARFAPGGVDPAADLAELTRGMAPARPSVQVAAFAVHEPGDRATATLRYGWPMVPGQRWSYDTELPLRRGDDGWRAVWSDAVVAPDLRPGERLRHLTLRAERGEILGAEGAQLAWEQEVERVGIDKTLAPASVYERTAPALARLVDIDPDAYLRRVRASGARAFVEAGVLRVHEPTQARLLARARAMRGVRTLPAVRPLGRTPTFARPILGVVRDATAEQIAASNGALRAGDLVGQAGLQKARDASLRGTSGAVVEAVDREDPAKRRELARYAAVAGTALETTIDVPMQEAAEAALAGVRPASAIVAIRPSDGHVLAAASGPGGDGASTATLGQYAPGSTFKTVSALGLFRAGLTPQSSVDCPPDITVAGKRFDNVEGYPADALGAVPLWRAFRHSCNSAFIGQRDRVPQAALRDAATSLGLNAQPNLVVGGYLGEVPGEAGEVEHAAAMIGQGRVLASPLGMATVAASIAAGRTVRPVLVPEAGTPAADAQPPLTASEAEQLRALLRRNPLAGVRGEPVHVKTGTASYGDPVRFHGWMIAVRGDLAIAVFVADGDSGSRAAGPVLRDFLARADRP